MDQIFLSLEESYAERIRNISLQKDTWGRFAAFCNPRVDYTGHPRPSLELARFSGDLGLSLLWIVQASLIRGLAREIDVLSEKSGSAAVLRNYGGTDIGALAHSEDETNPAIIDEKEGKFALSGVKKFITGGSTADFILLTGRNPGETGISRMLIVPVAVLPAAALPELDLDSLYTVSHSRFLLDGIVLDEDKLIPLESRTLRRTIKIWGIIERNMILEALLGFIIYLKGRLNSIAGIAFLSDDIIVEMLTEQEKIVTAQINAAESGNRIEEKLVDLQKLIDILGKFNTIDESAIEALPGELQYRLKDLLFFGKFFM